MVEQDRHGRKVRVLVKKEQLSDTTIVESEYSEDGTLVISEEVSGPSASVAYGEVRHKLKASFSPESMGDLAVLLGGARAGDLAYRLRLYFRGGRHALIDLMDLCDVGGVPYSYQAIGSATGVTYRPVAEGW